MRPVAPLLSALILWAQAGLGQIVQRFSTVPGISIRALEVVSDEEAWFAADRGVWGHTANAGRTWHIDSIRADTVYPQFRSMAVLNRGTVLLLSIASPAHLLRTDDAGHSWHQVYRDTRPDVFFDSMVFTDSLQGYAVSDPVNGHFLLIRTTDGGLTWTEPDATHWPTPAKAEAFFAASNANLSVAEGQIRLCTGGSRSRLLHSADGGHNFSSTDLPMPQGGTMTGAYAMHFINARMGAVAGGDYGRTAPDVPSLAVTADGGMSWRQLTGPRPFFGSSVRLRNESELYVTGHDGTFRFNLANGQAAEISGPEGSPLRFHVLRISPSGNSVWMAGSDGSIARQSVPPYQP